MMIFINDLGYFTGGAPLEEAEQKYLKFLIDTRLLMEVVPGKKGRLFSVCSGSLGLFYFNFLPHNVFDLIMIVCRFDEG